MHKIKRIYVKRDNQNERAIFLFYIYCPSILSDSWRALWNESFLEETLDVTVFFFNQIHVHSLRHPLAIHKTIRTPGSRNRSTKHRTKSAVQKAKGQVLANVMAVKRTESTGFIQKKVVETMTSLQNYASQKEQKAKIYGAHMFGVPRNRSVLGHNIIKKLSRIQLYIT